MIEYILIIALQVIGCGLHVAQKLFELDKKYDDDSLLEIFNQFLKSDRVTLAMSFFVLCLNLIVHYIIEGYSDLHLIKNYDLYSFGIAFILGYAGQRLIYKWLGKAEDSLNKKIDNKL